MATLRPLGACSELSAKSGAIRTSVLRQGSGCAPQGTRQDGSANDAAKAFGIVIGGATQYRWQQAQIRFKVVAIRLRLDGLHEAALSQYWARSTTSTTCRPVRIYQPRSARHDRARCPADLRLKFYGHHPPAVARAIPSDTMADNSQLARPRKPSDYRARRSSLG